MPADPQCAGCLATADPGHPITDHHDGCPVRYSQLANEAAVENADLRDALQACWDNFGDIMPESLWQQVKAALGVRVFTAEPLNPSWVNPHRSGIDSRGIQP